MPEIHAGDRVRAVAFTLDPGLRIWPVNTYLDVWRVVQVRSPDPADFDEAYRGSQSDCQRLFPNAVFGINDNETIPPGTLGTVESVSGQNVWVRWDNGTRLGLGPNDRIEILDPRRES